MQGVEEKLAGCGWRHSVVVTINIRSPLERSGDDTPGRLKLEARRSRSRLEVPVEPQQWKRRVLRTEHKGSRIAYMGRNSDLYFELFFGAARAGAVIAPVNWRLAPPEAVYVLNDCQAEALFVGPECRHLAQQIVAQVPSLRLIVAMEGGVDEWQSFESWRDANADHDPGVDVGLDDVAIQLYTSGTTGRPKGVMVRNSGLFGPRRPPTADVPAWNKWNDDDVILISMPNFHIGGTGWGFGTMLNGAKGVVTRDFDPEPCSRADRTRADHQDLLWFPRPCRRWFDTRTRARSTTRASDTCSTALRRFP